jgi:hypothetical protein
MARHILWCPFVKITIHSAYGVTDYVVPASVIQNYSPDSVEKMIRQKDVIKLFRVDIAEYILHLKTVSVPNQEAGQHYNFYI